MMIRHFAAAIVLAAAGSVRADDFVSGSDGSDGIFAPTESVQIDLGLAATAAWDTPSPVMGNGVYDPEKWAVVFKYDTINIPAGVVVTFSNHPSGAPVVWLAQGDVMIDGAVRLDGEHGGLGGEPFQYQSPGPGGFHGGSASAGTFASSAGFGPGGGGDAGGEGPGAYRTRGEGSNDPGQTYGTSRIFPLIGGSGGSGDAVQNNSNARGGAGGGAILIASSTLIDVQGSVRARGGAGWNTFPLSWGGSGGAIRLIANSIVGTGSMTALGHTNGISGGDGRIRLEGDLTGFLGSTDPNYAASGPGLVFPPPDAPVLRVAEVSTATSTDPVPLDPIASVDTVDVCTDDSFVTLHIEAQNIPVGTTVRVFVRPAHGAAYNFLSSPLAGDFALSTAMAEITLPDVPVEIQLKANWTP